MEHTDPHKKKSTVSVMEEVASISKRTVLTGITKVEKQVHTYDELISVTLRTEGTSVERVAIGIHVDKDNPPTTRIENGVTIIPILEEVLVFEKKLMLKEEIHIQRTVEDVPVKQRVSLRCENIAITHKEN